MNISESNLDPLLTEILFKGRIRWNGLGESIDKMQVEEGFGMKEKVYVFYACESTTEEARASMITALITAHSFLRRNNKRKIMGLLSWLVQYEARRLGNAFIPGRTELELEQDIITLEGCLRDIVSAFKGSDSDHLFKLTEEALCSGAGNNPGLEAALPLVLGFIRGRRCAKEEEYARRKREIEARATRNAAEAGLDVHRLLDVVASAPTAIPDQQPPSSDRAGKEKQHTGVAVDPSVLTAIIAFVAAHWLPMIVALVVVAGLIKLVLYFKAQSARNMQNVGEKSSQVTRAGPIQILKTAIAWLIRAKYIPLHIVILALALSPAILHVILIYKIVISGSLLLAGIGLLWQDIKALKQGRATEIGYGVFSIARKLSAAKLLALYEVYPEYAKETLKNKHLGLVSTLFLMYVASKQAKLVIGVILIACGSLFGYYVLAPTLAGALGGALWGYLLPYLVIVVWDFFWSYIMHNLGFAEFVRLYEEGKLGDDWTGIIKIKAQHYETELKAAGKLGKAYYALKHLHIFAIAVLPVPAGIVRFGIGRLSIAFLSGEIAHVAGAVIGLDPTLSPFSILGMDGLKSGLMQWNLWFTWMGIVNTAFIAMGLKITSRYSETRKAILNILVKRFNLGTLVANEIDMNLDKKLPEDELKHLQDRADLINFEGRPGLRQVLSGKDKLNIKIPFTSWRKELLYFTASILALIVILTSPLAGIIRLFETIFNLKRYAAPELLGMSKERKEYIMRNHPLYGLWIEEGKAFYSSFWYLSIIGAEIGAVIKIGNIAGGENAPAAVKNFGGSYLYQLTQLLEGPEGCISWGSHMLKSIDQSLGFSIGDIIYTRLGGYKDLDLAVKSDEMLLRESVVSENAKPDKKAPRILSDKSRQGRIDYVESLKQKNSDLTDMFYQDAKFVKEIQASGLSRAEFEDLLFEYVYG
ncbi:MAG: hypothetical protein NTY47_09035, partial [Candidatus Omnitrophica bacterium]|nr:hypothetical protein [Candidatus Omnitrophota bacterium]